MELGHHRCTLGFGFGNEQPKTHGCGQVLGQFHRKRVRQGSRHGTCDDDIDLREAVLHMDIDIDHFSTRKAIADVFLDHGSDLIGGVGHRQDRSPPELHRKHHDDGCNRRPAHATQDLGVAVEGVPAWDEPCGQERGTGSNDDTDDVCEEQQAGAEGELPLRELERDPNDGERWNEGYGDRNTGERIGGVPAHLAIGACSTRCEGDAEVEQVGRGPGHQLSGKRGLPAWDHEGDDGGEQDRKQRAGGDKQGTVKDPSRPPHHDRGCDTEDGKHERGNEHRTDHNCRGVGQDAESRDGRGQQHQRHESGEELFAGYASGEELVDHHDPLVVVDQLAPAPEPLQLGQRNRSDTSEEGRGCWVGGFRLASVRR